MLPGPDLNGSLTALEHVRTAATERAACERTRRDATADRLQRSHGSTAGQSNYVGCAVISLGRVAVADNFANARTRNAGIRSAGAAAVQDRPVRIRTGSVRLVDDQQCFVESRCRSSLLVMFVFRDNRNVYPRHESHRPSLALTAAANQQQVADLVPCNLLHGPSALAPALVLQLKRCSLRASRNVSPASRATTGKRIKPFAKICHFLLLVNSWN